MKLFYSIPSILFLFAFFPSFSQPWQRVGVDTLTLKNTASIALDGKNIPYIVCREESYPNGLMVKKLIGNHWVKIGNNISKGSGLDTHIIIGPDNLPVVAFADTSNGVAVRKFNGVSWDSLGNFGNLYDYFSIAVDSANAIYLAVEGSNYQNTFVKKYTNGNWQNVGVDTASSASSSEVSVAINPKTNQPYIFYNVYNSQQVLIKKFDGSDWVYVGGMNLNQSTYAAEELTIAFAPDGKPYISFKDVNGEERVNVYTLENNTWVVAGNVSSLPAYCRNLSLAVSTDETPYICFRRPYSENKARVMKLEDGKWQNVGDSLFAEFSRNDFPFALGRANTPYFLSVNKSSFKGTLYRFAIVPTDPIRITSGLFSQPDCQPWQQDSSQWVSFHETGNNSSFLDMQTYFQTFPGQLCDYQSYIYEGNGLRSSYGWNGGALKANNGYSSRNFKIKFSGSPFSIFAGLRLFYTVQELTDFVNEFNLQHSTSYTASDIFIVQYDGTNQDYLLSNNSDTQSDYTKIYPTLYYYGTNNQYCYLEFYTTHCSEFYAALSDSTGNVLPVSLLNFTTTLIDNKAILKWNTASEINTSRFIISRSTDGLTFSNISSLVAKGSSNFTQTYQYEDDVTHLPVGQIYYRIEEIDTDGKQTASQVRSVSKLAQTSIKIFPNPARRFVQVSGDSLALIKLYDITGKLINCVKPSNYQTIISTEKLANGPYFLSILLKDGNSYKEKIIVKN